MRLRGLLLAGLLSLPATAHAGDAAGRRIIGFSPDGTTFAFEQFTMLYDDDRAFSEIHIIDTRTDRFVRGAPILVRKSGDDGLDDKAAREDAAAKAKPLLDRLRVGDAGTRIAGKPSMDLDAVGIYHMEPQPLAKSQELALPDGRTARLAITDRALGTARCSGAGGRATYGTVPVAGLVLTLTLDKAAPIVLAEDQRLPKGRRCAMSYGIAEAYLHTAPDGALTLAALIEFADSHEYHAGPTRRSMAVTKRLPPR